MNALAARRTLAALIALGALLVGGFLLLALGAGGLLGGFGSERFVVATLALALYVAALVTAAGWYALQPGRIVGWAAAVLCLPAALFLGQVASGAWHLRQVARAAAGPDSPQAQAARDELEQLGRRGGRQPHVQELVHQLGRARDDESRRRIVDLLGRASYQDKEALAALEELQAETRGDEGREELNDALLAAILGVNPYDREAQREALERGLEIPIQLLED